MHDSTCARSQQIIFSFVNEDKFLGRILTRNFSSSRIIWRNFPDENVGSCRNKHSSSARRDGKRKIVRFADAWGYQKPPIWCLAFMVSFASPLPATINLPPESVYFLRLLLIRANIERSNVLMANVKLHPGNHWAFSVREEINKTSSSWLMSCWAHAVETRWDPTVHEIKWKAQ